MTKSRPSKTSGIAPYIWAKTHTHTHTNVGIKTDTHPQKNSQASLFESLSFTDSVKEKEIVLRFNKNVAVQS